MSLDEPLSNGGTMGWLAMASGVVILIVSVFLLFGEPRRGTGLVLILTAGIPIVLGFLGTLVGHWQMQEVLDAMAGEPDPEQIEAGRQAAKASTYLGLYSAAPAVLVGLGMLLFGRSSDEPTT